MRPKCPLQPPFQHFVSLRYLFYKWSECLHFKKYSRSEQHFTQLCDAVLYEFKCQFESKAFWILKIVFEHKILAALPWQKRGLHIILVNGRRTEADLPRKRILPRESWAFEQITLALDNQNKQTMLKTTLRWFSINDLTYTAASAISASSKPLDLIRSQVPPNAAPATMLRDPHIDDGFEVQLGMKISDEYGST